MAFLLTRRSVILCPHGGVIVHIPASFSAELIDGELPLLLNDFYNVIGCSNFQGGNASFCLKVMWTSGSLNRLINGVPVLTNESIGLCQNALGVNQGAAIITSFQTRETD